VNSGQLISISYSRPGNSFRKVSTTEGIALPHLFLLASSSRSQLLF
jgi:hypothetical protein